jgi:MFS family permease
MHALGHTLPPASQPYYGWRIVVAVFVLATFGWGVGFYGPPIYLHAVREVRGWSLALVSTAVTVHFVFGALVVANLPRLYGRFGISAVTKMGCIALTTGTVGWAIAQQPWQLFLATLLSGTGWATMGAAAVNAIIAPWFVKTRPAALASAYNGASIAGVVFSPLWVILIGALGFPAAAVAIGLVTVATIWMLADIYFAKKPEDLALAPDGNASGAPSIFVTSPLAKPMPGNALWRNRSFITLAGGMALGLFAQIGLLAHLFSLLVPALGAQVAGLAASAAAASAIVGRTLFGWLMPAGADRRLFSSASYVVQIIGSLAFLFAAGQNVPLLLLGVVLFGFGIGNGTFLPPLIAQVEFAKEDVARVVPMIVAVSQGTYAFAPAAFGLIREFMPQTSVASPAAAPYLFVAAAVIQLAAIFCFLLGRRRS